MCVCVCVRVYVYMYTHTFIIETAIVILFFPVHIQVW